MRVGPDPQEHLQQASLTVESILEDASNVTLRVVLGGDGRAVYKPISGERPLHDFPSGTLARREVASYLVSRAGRWDLVPTTVLRDGPLGPGAVQVWVEDPPAGAAVGAGVLQVITPQEVQPGWLPVVQARAEDGRPLVVVHADDPVLRSVAVLDVVLNNADRKASHLLRDPAGRMWAIDHGLCLHEEPKLRTVFWGWAGQPLTSPDLSHLDHLQDALRAGSPLPDELATLLDPPEVQALRDRVRLLVDSGRHPAPPEDRYPLPWPLW